MAEVEQQCCECGKPLELSVELALTFAQIAREFLGGTLTGITCSECEARSVASLQPGPGRDG